MGIQDAVHSDAFLTELNRHAGTILKRSGETFDEVQGMVQNVSVSRGKLAFVNGWLRTADELRSCPCLAILRLRNPSYRVKQGGIDSSTLSESISTKGVRQ